jgi:tetratricopeptide (TPR) repeat protein
VKVSSSGHWRQCRRDRVLGGGWSHFSTQRTDWKLAGQWRILVQKVTTYHGCIGIRSAIGPQSSMKNSLTTRLCLLALFALPTWGQQYTAKIVTEGNTPLPTTPLVIPQVSDRLVPFCSIANIFGNGTVVYVMNYRAQVYDPKNADVCPVTVRLNGFRTTAGTLRQGATIMLKRVGDHEGSTISMASLNAPKDAKKAYDKGAAAMSEQKWAAAQKDFEKAVGIYPEYSQAWSDLGEVLSQQSQTDDARAAFEHAIQVDPKYVKAYVQLARLLVTEKKNQEAIEITSKAFQYNPLEFPAIYFYDAVANYNLRHLDAAATSAERAIQLDTDHEIPRAENLLGTILAAKGDYPGAIEHLKKYVALAPKAPDIPKVQQEIEQLESHTQSTPK